MKNRFEKPATAAMEHVASVYAEAMPTITALPLSVFTHEKGGVDAKFCAVNVATLHVEDIGRQVKREVCAAMFTRRIEEIRSAYMDGLFSRTEFMDKTSELLNSLACEFEG